MGLNPQTEPHRFLQSAVHSLLGSAGVVLVSYVGYRVKLDLTTTALLCLMVVVLVSLGGRFVPAALASLVAVLSVNYFFVPPLFTIGLASPLDEIAVIAFLATALVISRLVARLRQSFSEVQALNERLQLVVDTIPTLVSRTRGDGTLEFMNRRWREYLGLPLEEVKDWAWTAALHPEDRERFVEQWRAALSSGRPLESEARMRRADGEYHWLSINVVPVRDSEGKIVNWYGSSTDIEERTRAEERARQADRERRTVIDTIPALLWSTLPDGSSDFNNKRWLDYTGLSAGQAEGWGYTDVIHPEDYERRTPMWRAAFAAGEPMEDEARLRRADGQYRWFLHRAVPLGDEGGNILKWVGTSTDIEDLKLAEEALRERARLLDLTHDSVFVRDVDDVITYWNKGAEDLYGWTSEEALGKVTHALMRTVFPAPLQDINAELLRTGRWEGELVHTTRDGRQLTLASRWSLQRDEHGRAVGTLETNNDITEQHKSRAALEKAFAAIQQSEDRLRLIIDTIPALVWSTLPDGSVAFVNRRWLEYTGLSWDEALRFGWTAVLHPDERSALLEERQAALARGEAYEIEARIRRADGEYRWLKRQVVPFRDEHGHITRWYGAGTDVEDLKRAEGVLREQARLLDLTHDTVFVRDMNEVITYWNRGAEALYGWSRDEAVGKISHQLTQTIFPAPLDEINQELLLTGRWEGQLVHAKRDGTRVVVASRWSLQRDKLGQAAAILETNNDVTEQKRAQTDLRASEGRYRHIFQSAGVSIWEEDFSAVKAAVDHLKAQGVTDFRAYFAAHPDFVRQAIALVKIIDVNDTTLTLLQARSKDELLVSLDRVFLPETQEAFAEELIAIAEGQARYEAETVLQTLDGKRLSVLFTITFPADSATLESVLVAITDITERKRLDNELRRSQAYLVAAQELGNTGSWARRVSTGENYWSEEVFRIFGLDPRTTPPTYAAATLFLHPDDRESVERTIEDAMRDGRNFEMDARIVRPDGSIRHIHFRGEPVFDRTGAIDEYIGVIMDITKRKRTERALRRARERALQARFSAVLEERTRLARDIHDTLLQGFTGIALKLVAAINRVTEPVESVVALRDLVGLAQRTLADARRAVWDLRSPALAAADFPSALRTAAEDCVRGTTLELEYDVGGSARPVDPEVEAVVIRVAQEAITNVVKHAAARIVRVRLSFETRGIRLSVIDDGQGFTVEPDFQAYGGHWGLLGMRERASQVHGKLSLRSTPGHGTEVVLLVPYAPSHRSPAESAASGSAS
jgi:PAS domain S-box-containing protein